MGVDPRVNQVLGLAARPRLATREVRLGGNGRGRWASVESDEYRGRMRVIGLMSGTSADGVDAALVEWPDSGAARPFRLRAFHSRPFDAALQDRVHALAAGRLDGKDVLRELAALDVLLGERFAQAAAAVAREAGVALSDVDAIASHGQTVAHHPELRATLQIGDPSLIAERTGVTTIADFRPRDLAAGGEGAPLAPFFHWAALADPDEFRVVLNLGGIANVTALPRGGDPDAVVAFDVGPANALVDTVVRGASQGRERMDRDGARARRGRVDAALLARLLDDEFLRRAPPKSTGRERYGWAEGEALLAEWTRGGRDADDLVATLVAFNAEAVARACRDFCGGVPQRLLVCGGGARNPAQMDALAAALPGARVEPTDRAGVPADAVEAMAFSLMGRNALLGIPNHLPRTTGAARATVLGELCLGGPKSRS
jgi:anhydro-N-acetylmuramic acid kinase